MALDLPTLLSPQASLRRSPPRACTALPAPGARARCGRGSAKKPFIFLIRDGAGTVTSTPVTLPVLLNSQNELFVVNPGGQQVDMGLIV